MNMAVGIILLFLFCTFNGVLSDFLIKRGLIHNMKTTIIFLIYCGASSIAFGLFLANMFIL